ncbi:hypothetical protein U9K52_08755 [Chryseobacterium sp. MHB01]|uniref:hypothetical protein n=1 Tax=Chryseobacterium sp. MHB01 TaxID=3109433 RepID=UPI002AFF21A8|nr:hypothetical protein [Chryseobacterium sp. MHB01]MEA1848997.1 hypothetical protein [Chryseobacterium sp. MHB01]
MKKKNKVCTEYIKNLHIRNEIFYDRGEIDFNEYISNNFLCIKKMKNAILTDEQQIIIIDAIHGELDLKKFRLGINVVKLGFS